MSAPSSEESLRALAQAANSEAWKLLGKSGRTVDEDLRLLSCAHASLYSWAAAGGTGIHQARGHWLLSRIHCVLGDARLAAEHARLCEKHTAAAGDRKDFDEAYAVEARARAAALNRDHASAIELKARARALGDRIANAEDREIFGGDFAAEPWFGA